MKRVIFVLLATMLASCMPVEKQERKQTEEKHLVIDVSTPPVKEKPKESLPDGWLLVWHDEFESRDSLKNWNIVDWESPKNGELQYYTPNNVSVEDGNLIITSKKERMGGKPYTSGAVTTLNKFHFKYGKVEIRAKLPGSGKGIFPAMWMKPVDNQISFPEIDFMEYIGDHPEEIYHVLHWREQGKKKRDFIKVVAKGIQRGYHTFGVEWTPTKVAYFIDGKKTFETNKYSPDTEMYLYINTAIGGTWPGTPTKDVVFPRQMKVDYVRIYQQKRR